MPDAKKIRIGCQSWGYEDWVTRTGGPTVFYPRGTKQGEMLQLYSRVFDTIEIDSTAYGVPPAANFEGWYEKSEPGFKFALKVPKEITHDREMRPGGLAVFREFLDRAALLKEKLGPVLIQLPARFEASKENAQNVREFFRHLPSGIDFAIEFRNPDWFREWTYQETAAAGVSLALVEGPWIPRNTMFEAAQYAGEKLAYLRLMGVRDLEGFDRVQRPQDDVIEAWAGVIRGLSAGEVCVYVDNYFEGHAPATANKLKKLLGLPVTDPAALEEQPSLF